MGIPGAPALGMRSSVSMPSFPEVSEVQYDFGGLTPAYLEADICSAVGALMRAGRTSCYELQPSHPDFPQHKRALAWMLESGYASEKSQFCWQLTDRGRNSLRLFRTSPLPN